MSQRHVVFLNLFNSSYVDCCYPLQQFPITHMISAWWKLLRPKWFTPAPNGTSYPNTRVHKYPKRFLFPSTTRTRAFLFDKKACLLVRREDISSCRTRRRDCLSNKKTCPLVEQEDMSSCRPRRHAFLSNKKTCLPFEQEDSCVEGK